MKLATKRDAGHSHRAPRPAADLLDAALVEHRDPVGEAQRLLLIVRHIQDGDAGLAGGCAGVSGWISSRSFLSSAESGSSIRRTGGS